MSAIHEYGAPGGALVDQKPAQNDRRRQHLVPPRARPSVSVVVPTLNEAGSLAWVLERLPKWVDEVVLVDGLSTDETEVIARSVRGQLVVVHQPARGKGAALRAGFSAATSDVIVMIDADGSTNPTEINAFVRALENGADFVKGSRYLAPGGSEDLSRLRGVGNTAFTRMVNLMYGTRFTDLCYGYCAFWRRNLDALALAADGFEIETELVLSAVKAKLAIVEVPSFELKRRAGKSNLNAYRDGRRVLRTILQERTRSSKPRSRFAQPIRLVPAQLAEPGTDGWLPAGSDQRRHDRRHASPGESGYSGPERRQQDRRASLPRTVTVYRPVPDPERRSQRLQA
jgi:hypothetical protein